VAKPRTTRSLRIMTKGAADGPIWPETVKGAEFPEAFHGLPALLHIAAVKLTPSGSLLSAPWHGPRELINLNPHSLHKC
jgi:hypothetical protein